jgi:molybdopterin synthase catalytic subunit
MIEITEQAISPRAVLDSIGDDAQGALVTFIGTVRSTSSSGKPLLFFDIQGSRERAQRELEQVAAEVQRRWAPQGMAICHRIGQLKAGEIILAAAIATPHRTEAFQACQYVVDCMKQASSFDEKEVLSS